MSGNFFGNSNIPIEPNADIRQAANGIREIFVAYTNAGFTEAQAMQLTLTMLSSGIQGNKD